jgi:ribosomal protein S18 acetylase RimI-like enzyme
MAASFRRRRVSVLVRHLTPEDIPVLREARLEGLRNHPEAFSADLAVWEALTPEVWRTRVMNGNWFGAFVGDALAGICAISVSYSSKTSHIGEFGAMYVRAGHRGKHVGDALIDAVIAFATQKFELVTLTVIAENAPAIALYERHGFATTGKMPRAIRIGDRYYDELYMVRDLVGTS